MWDKASNAWTSYNYAKSIVFDQFKWSAAMGNFDTIERHSYNMILCIGDAGFNLTKEI